MTTESSAEAIERYAQETDMKVTGDTSQNPDKTGQVVIAASSRIRAQEWDIFFSN